MSLITTLAVVLALQQQPPRHQPQPEPTARPLPAGRDPQAFRGFATLTYWYPDLDATVEADELPAFEGSRVKADHDLRMDDNDGFVVFKGGYVARNEVGPDSTELGGLFMTYWDHTWRGETDLSGTETFNGSVYPAGTHVKSRFGASALGFDFVAYSPIQAENTSMGASFGIRLTDVKLSMDGGAGIGETSEHRSIGYLGMGINWKTNPTPMFFMSASFNPYFSVLHAEYGDLAKSKEWSATWFEGEIAAGWEFHHVHVEVGRRLIWNRLVLRNRDETGGEYDEYRWNINGYFLTVGVAF